MEVNVKSAVKMFFSKSSFEMIYIEAFANAIDAEATEFNIHITLPEEGDWANMVLEISDNGVGFTDDRFRKFRRLFDVEEQSHKGLGRLIYLCYFGKVAIESVFQPGRVRRFEFSESFSGACSIDETELRTTGAYFKLTDFTGDRIGKLDYVNPGYLKQMLLENFYMKLYRAKLAGRPMAISITQTVAGVDDSESITSLTIPDFQIKELEARTDMFQSMSLYYYVKELKNKTDRRVITALAVEDRSHKVSIIADENMPYGYEMVFLLMSETFQGNIDEARQNLRIADATLNQVNAIFREAIASVVNEQFPKIALENKKRKDNLEKTYPHLSGYFNSQEIGYSAQSDVLKRAQDRYFKDQKEILGATELSDEQYEKSMVLSARALAEYILFRQNVIKKMKSFDAKNVEADLHNLLAPKGAEFQEGELIKDLYRNNVWVLDDKFMSYCTVLSEAEMSKVINVLTEGEVKDNDDDRPDITMFFSGNPRAEGSKVDVVVVELKRLGIPAEQNSIVEFQLDTRTQRLAEYFDERIQRMWFFGIVEFDDRYKLHLMNNGYRPLYSNGSTFFRSKTVFSDLAQTKSVIQNSYIMDFKALIDDASSRNETFLQILKSHFKKN